MTQTTLDFSMSGDLVAGVDEVGRGPLAGDVVAAAVILPAAHTLKGLTDSKKLSEKQRDVLFEPICQQAVAVSIGRASVAEIDRLNILHATMLAMSRAVKGLTMTPGFCFVDGNRIPDGLPCPAEAVVKGDSKVASISAASIVAKVTRDREMMALHDRYPHYGFDRHKGYGTKLHLEALKQYGVLPVHRQTFAPVKHLLNRNS